MSYSPPSIKDIHANKKREMTAILFKGHCANGGIRKKLQMPQVAPSTPPQQPYNHAPPSIKKQRKALEKVSKALRF